MASWRVWLVTKSYTGKDQAKRAQAADRAADARKIEDYVNERLKEEATQFEYFTIAQDLGLPVETVAAIMQKQEGWGSHGITFHPPHGISKPAR